jgi:hypothetical protein
MVDSVTCRKKRDCKNYKKQCWNCEDNEENDVLEYNFERKPDTPIKIHYQQGVNYACNFAVEPLDFKMTKEPSLVTCKNCKKIISRTLT